LAARRLADLEAVFAALAHEQRRHILLTLKFRGGRLSAGAIADRFSCSWPTTTRHLKVLESAGLVRVEKRGRERIYLLQAERLLLVAGEWLAWFEDGDSLSISAKIDS
jgi:DNA-binding transcriptional ArsR family regulator